MKKRRHVTVEKKLEEKIKSQREKIDKIFLESSEESEKYQRAKKLEDQLNHLEKLICYVRRFEKEDGLALSQFDNDCRFYDFKLTSVFELKKQLKSNVRNMYYEKPICLSSIKSESYDSKLYVNVFEFFGGCDYENDFCLERIEDLLYEKGFIDGEKILTDDDWNNIVDEYRVKYYQGKGALIYVCIKEKLT